jgi:lysozyme
MDTEGTHLVSSYEGLGPNKKGDRYFPYLCESHKLTIGYGHVLAPNESYPIGLTMQEAEALLARDLVRYENQVKRDCKIPLTAYEFRALTSLDFNTGEAPLFGTMGKFLNAGNLTQAAAHFLDWVMAGPDSNHLHVSEGLVRRRLCEANYFLHGKLEIVDSYSDMIAMLDKLTAEKVLNRFDRYNVVRKQKPAIIRPTRALAFLDASESRC